MNKRYIVDLTAEERAGPPALLTKGVAPARRLTRARILLLADEGGTAQEIAAALHVHPATIERTRRRFVEGGVERALSDQPRPGGRPKLDGKQAAHAQKNALKPWRRKQWCIAAVGADFVWRMEDVLDLHAEPYDPERPVVCFDEQPRQLLAEVRTPVPAAPGRPQRIAYEYRRQGTANPFLTFGPLAGRRHVAVTPQRTAQDFAQQLRTLVDVYYPAAAVVAVVLDNLSTHSPAALCQAFPPDEARRTHPQAARVPLHAQARPRSVHNRCRRGR